MSNDNFVASFDHHEDAEKILFGGPWCYNNQLVLVDLWDQETLVESWVFGPQAFWV